MSSDREPCPYRLVDDAGGAFAIGVLGGTVWHSFGGYRNGPKGQKLESMLHRVRTRVPILGGGFAVWGTLFSAFDCTISYARKKEDPWNAILSGAATGALLAIRAGPKTAFKSGLMGGVILAAIEGFSITIQRVVMPYLEKKQMEQNEHMVDMLEPPVDPLRYRKKSHTSTPVWEPSTLSAPKQSSGFDIDSMYQSDSKLEPLTDWDNNSSDEKKEEGSKKSGWFW